MNSQINENKQVSPYFLFFLIHGSQTGIAVLRFQGNVSKGAGSEAWMSVLALGLSFQLLFMMMLYILKQSTAGDILSFHKDLLGKKLGGALNLLLACYFSLAGVAVVYGYIDLLQVWVFDGIPSWEYALLFCCLIFYLVSGGFRVITGVAFWGVVIPAILLISFFSIANYLEVSYLQPLFDHSLKDHFNSVKAAVPLFLGVETALVYFPFIKNGKKASKWGHFALLFTTILYTVVTLFTFMFFAQGKIHHLTWPTLTMIKIIQFPFLERFEFIFIFTWLLVIMPVICLYLWSAIRAIKITLPKIKPTYILLFLLAVYFLVNSQLTDIFYTQYIQKMVDISSSTFLFGYIPLLFIVSVIRQFIKKQKEG
ncbi:GerAB/ArcD/ProY family transporter [Fredinandcohnia onubensis]|uniref:GerAB/ArcD/ProY family transporter n=1 Tax=Fredinandcohnia onubensis TaxID=1571209 RepID=UPI000C0C051D|nr:GerAB/ArcD/ProY family transporter [Fredinandcohnia onubensis]